MRPAWIETDLATFRANVASSCELASSARVCAVVKGNAYGRGAVECARAAPEAGASWLAVAMVGEAQVLRDAGIDPPILILGESSPEEAEEILAADATAMAATAEVAEALSKAALRMGRKAEIHVKIDSGMGRQGIRWDEVETFASLLSRLPGLRVTGLFTHFASADAEPDFTRWQFRAFLDACAKVKAVLGPVAFRHCCNTAAAVLYPEMHLSMIRPGAGMYGISPGLPAEKTKGLRHVLSLRAKVILVKELQAGDTAGYGQTWQASGRRRIAIFSPKGLVKKAEHLIGDNGHLDTAATGTDLFEFQIDPDETGTFYAVIYATQTPAAGQGNRNRQPKAVLQRGAGVPVYPQKDDCVNPAPNFDIGEAPQHQGWFAWGTHYVVFPHGSLPSDSEAELLLSIDAIFYLYTHGAEGCATIADTGWLAGKEFPNYDEERDLALSHYAGRFPRLRLVVFHSCKSAQSSPERGNLLDAAMATGADCAIGFQTEVLTGECGRRWAEAFFLALCAVGSSVGDAADFAKRMVQMIAQGDPAGYDSYRIAGPRDTNVYPARWGE